jgi:hypothetical protein
MYIHSDSSAGQLFIRGFLGPRGQAVVEATGVIMVKRKSKSFPSNLPMIYSSIILKMMRICLLCSYHRLGEIDRGADASSHVQTGV